jgi:DNA polymerase
MKSKLQVHVEKWKDGCGACICATARKVVHVRGKIPADVLFVGEAPGPSENVIGLPFMGPAGHLLDQIVARAFDGINETGEEDPRCAFCNLVGCLPADEAGEKFHEPDEESIVACQPRLAELIGLAKPKLIICVGKLAWKWLQPGGYMHTLKADNVLGYHVYFEFIDHPAFILRSSIAQRGLLVQKATVKIAEAYERHVLKR